MTSDARLARPDDNLPDHVYGARHRCARLRSRRARYGRIMGATKRLPVPLSDPLSDLWSDPAAHYPERER